MRDIIRIFRENGFTLLMWDTHSRDWRGQTRIGYELWDRGALVFTGEDFSGSPMHADDSDATVASLLSFLSLKPGDTDREYFDSYTPAQLEWVESGRADDLSMIVSDIECAA